MAKKIFTIQLMDKEFTVKTDEPRERMDQVVAFVNNYLKRIKTQNPFKDRTTISLLAVLNITSEYIETKENKFKFERKVREKIDHLIKLIDNFLQDGSCGVRDQ